MSTRVFLKPQVKIEPLLCGWYAWTHLLSPASHAMNIVFRHLPLLESFVKNPDIHLSASRDPSLFGGPFVNLTKDRIEDVRALIARTAVTCAQLVEMGRDLKQLDCRLQETATGYSMSELYAQVPESLAGAVEFLYDLNNHPKLRIHEELLYDQAPDTGAQEILLSSQGDDQRPFFMSTPRIPNQGEVLIPIAFADRRLDLLSAMRTRAAPLEDMARALNIPAGQRPTFDAMFTPEPPLRRTTRYEGDEVRVRYFGHACVLIETASTSILLDPIVATEPGKGDGRFTFHDLPDHIDYVVLSHNHQDHCVPEMLIQLRSRVGHVVVPGNNRGNIADPSMTLMLRHLGFTHIETLSAFDTVKVPEGCIMSLPFPGEHVDLDVHARQGILVELSGRRLAFLVDSDGWDSRLYRRIVQRIGRELDGLFIGMECHGAPLTWLYGPLLTKPISRKNDESRRLSGLNCERAWNVLKEFAVRKVFVYAMGQEPWMKYLMGLHYEPDSIQLREVAAFLSRCREEGIAAENLYLSKEWLV